MSTDDSTTGDRQTEATPHAAKLQAARDIVRDMDRSAEAVRTLRSIYKGDIRPTQPIKIFAYVEADNGAEPVEVQLGNAQAADLPDMIDKLARNLRRDWAALKQCADEALQQLESAVDQ